MSLELARTRRIEALSKRNHDRVLVAPARHKDYVKMPEDGTVAAYLLEAINLGITIDQLIAETGWSKSTIIVNLYKVAKKSGVGINRRRETLHLVLPKGVRDAFPAKRIKTVNESTRNHVGSPLIAHA